MSFDHDAELGGLVHPSDNDGMPLSYSIVLAGTYLAIADIMQFERGVTLNRINVPKGFRGRRHGSQLLRQICDAADKYDQPIYLAVSPSDGLDHHQLCLWYMRYGFTPVYDTPGMFKRPKSSVARLPYKLDTSVDCATMAELLHYADWSKETRGAVVEKALRFLFTNDQRWLNNKVGRMVDVSDMKNQGEAQ